MNARRMTAAAFALALGFALPALFASGTDESAAAAGSGRPAEPVTLTMMNAEAAAQPLRADSP